MALSEIEAVCRSCGREFRATPTRSFLGFQKVKCPACSKYALYPLTRGYRITYWVIVVFMIGAIVNSVRQGLLSFPGLLGIAVIIGLVRDWKIRKAVMRPTKQASV